MSELPGRLKCFGEDTTPASSICTDANISLCVQAPSEQSTSLLDVSELELDKQEMKMTLQSAAVNDPPSNEENISTYRKELVHRLLIDQEALRSTKRTDKEREGGSRSGKGVTEDEQETQDDENDRSEATDENKRRVESNQSSEMVLNVRSMTAAGGQSVASSDQNDGGNNEDGKVGNREDQNKDEERDDNEKKLEGKNSSRQNEEDEQEGERNDDNLDPTDNEQRNDSERRMIENEEEKTDDPDGVVEAFDEDRVCRTKEMVEDRYRPTDFSDQTATGRENGESSSQNIIGEDCGGRNSSSESEIGVWMEDMNEGASGVPSDESVSDNVLHSRKRLSNSFDPSLSDVKHSRVSQSEVYLRVDAATSSGLFPAEVAIAIAPFLFPLEVSHLFVSMNFAVSLGADNISDRIFAREMEPVMELLVPMPQFVRDRLIHYYTGNLPIFFQYVAINRRRLWEADHIDSRMNFGAVDEVDEDLWEKIVFPITNFRDDESRSSSLARRWIDNFTSCSSALHRHIEENMGTHPIVLQHGLCHPEVKDTEPVLVELRVQVLESEPHHSHAMRLLINSLVVPIFIYRSYGPAGWMVYHVFTDTLLDATVLITRCNKKELQWCEHSQSYCLIPSAANRLYAKLCRPSFLANQKTKSLNQLGSGSGRRGRYRMVRGFLKSMLERGKSDVQTSFECLKVVRQIGVCEMDQQLVVLVMIAALKSMKHQREVAENELFRSGFSAEMGQFMCCVNDVGLIEALAQFIYCPCSQCTPYLYEDEIDDSVPVLSNRNC